MVHLVRRAIGSFSNAKPETLSEISRFLLPAELNLWLTMAGRDQRHSIDVLKRFLVLYPDASRAQGAAALLHDAMEDCGVTKSDLVDRFGASVAELVDGLTNEARHRLVRHRPATLGLASRLPGITPATVALLLIHLKKRGRAA